MKTYAEISKSRPPGGWKNVSDESDHMIYARAEAIASLCSFNTRSVYEFAAREGNDLKDILAKLSKGKVASNPIFGPLFDAVVFGSHFNPNPLKI